MHVKKKKNEKVINFITNKTNFSLARDLGLALNSGAYLSALCRTWVGSYRLEDAYEVEQLKTILRENYKTEEG